MEIKELEGCTRVALKTFLFFIVIFMKNGCLKESIVCFHSLLCIMGSSTLVCEHQAGLRTFCFILPLQIQKVPSGPQITSSPLDNIIFLS